MSEGGVWGWDNSHTKNLTIAVLLVSGNVGSSEKLLNGLGGVEIRLFDTHL